MALFSRSPDNPVLAPDPRRPWEAAAVFNGCPLEAGGLVHLFYRAESASRQAPVSSIGRAVSTDGRHFTDRAHFIAPEHDWERYGCEDPRVTELGGRVFVFYTALSTYPFSADGIRVGLAITRDLVRIEEKHLVTPFNAKAMALFPRKVGGKIAAVLTANTDRPPARIAVALFDRISQLWSPAYWQEWYGALDKHALALARTPADHVEVGAPPLYTRAGWLLIYSYIQNYFSGEPLFGIEAVLLDRADPHRIIGRTDRPLLIPEADYEISGRVPRVVFPSGALRRKGTVWLYYGAADSTCCLATMKLADLLGEVRPSAGRARLTRFAGNPIITPLAEHPWEAKATFNPAALHEGGRVHLLYRAMSPDNTSTLGYASSTDGLHITERLAEPVYVPRKDFEQKSVPGANSGCEDPRLTRLGEILYLCYTAYDGKGPPRVALSSIALKDFLTKRWRWAEPKLISPPSMDDKDATLFSRKIGGRYVFLHRLGNGIWIDFLPDLNLGGETWLGGELFMLPREAAHGSRKIGIAAPPIETDDGWLLLYHGIAKSDDGHYHLRAALLDRDDPRRVLARTRETIFEPETPYERTGHTARVIFPCGAVLRDGTLFVYYGGADTVVGVAMIEVAQLLREFRRKRSQ